MVALAQRNHLLESPRYDLATMLVKLIDIAISREELTIPARK
jgi:hypothetical protein